MTMTFKRQSAFRLTYVRGVLAAYQNENARQCIDDAKTRRSRWGLRPCGRRPGRKEDNIRVSLERCRPCLYSRWCEVETMILLPVRVQGIFFGTREFSESSSLTLQYIFYLLRKSWWMERMMVKLFFPEKLGGELRIYCMRHFLYDTRKYGM
jgi:hypothetical protein